MTRDLLLIHAFPLDSTMWEPQRAIRPAALTPDLPGFGGTAGVGDVMTMEACAARCLEALDEAGSTRAVVCGLSMGGYVAFELWRRHPERIAGLVFANTRAEADDDKGVASRQALAERLRSEGSAFLVAQPPPLLSADADEGLRARVGAILGAQSAEAIAAASLGMAARPDSTPDLATIDVPTLVITSTGDALIPSEITSRIAAGVPGARLETIEGAGHLSNLEAPEAFNALVEAHVARCG